MVKHFSFFCFGIYGGFINAGIGILIMLFLNRLNQMSLLKNIIISMPIPAFIKPP